MKRVTPEAGLLKAVTDLLTAERIWWMRCNSGVHILRDGQGKKRVFKGHRAGTADLLALPRLSGDRARTLFMPKGYLAGDPDCFALRWCSVGSSFEALVSLPLWIECKRPKGGVQSQAQKAFQAEVEAEGHTYLLVRDVQQVIEFLRRAR